MKQIYIIYFNKIFDIILYFYSINKCIKIIKIRIKIVKFNNNKIKNVFSE